MDLRARPSSESAHVLASPAAHDNPCQQLLDDGNVIRAGARGHQAPHHVIIAPCTTQHSTAQRSNYKVWLRLQQGLCCIRQHASFLQHRTRSSQQHGVPCHCQSVLPQAVLRVHAATVHALSEMDPSSMVEHCLVTTVNVLRGRKCTAGSIAKQKHGMPCHVCMFGAAGNRTAVRCTRWCFHGKLLQTVTQAQRIALCAVLCLTK